MCDIVFENTKSCSKTVNRTSDYAEVALRRVLQEVVRDVLQKPQEIICAGVSFLIKWDTVALQPHWKRDSCTGVFLWILRNL